MNFDLKRLEPQKRTDPPEIEVQKVTNFYQMRLIQRGYKCYHEASHAAIAKYFALTFFSINHPENNFLSSKPEKGLLLYGPVGTGKTFALQIFSGIFKIPFISAQALIQEYGKNGESGFWEFAKSFDGQDLNVDDICAERDLKSYGNETPMLDFFAHRERLFRDFGTLTNYSTNAKDRAALVERYGDRTASRILGMCTGVLVDGEDKRQDNPNHKAQGV